MTYLVDITVPGPTITQPPSFEEFQVKGLTIILATDLNDEITTQADEVLIWPAFGTLETSNSSLFFSRIAT